MLLNLNRARAAMDLCSIDAIVATTPENVTYMSDFYGWRLWLYRGNTPARGLQSCMILPKEGDPVMIVPRLESSALAQQPVWVSDIRTYGKFNAKRITDPEADDLTEEERRLWIKEDPGSGDYASYDIALTNTLNRLGLGRAVVAVEHFGLSPGAFGALERSFPHLAMKEASDILKYIRAVKTEEEIVRLRKAAEANEKAILAVLKWARKGITEKELAQVHREAIAEQGGTQAFYHCPAGARGSSFFPPSDHALGAGDMLMVDAGCWLDQYHADGGACGVVGSPAEEDVKFYGICEAAVNRGLELIRGGTHLVEIQKAMDSALEENELETGLLTYIHGIGIEVRDAPVASNWDKKSGQEPEGINRVDHVLEPGMVLNIEAPLPIFHHGCYQVEYSLIVTEKGFEPLIEQHRHLFELPL